MKLKNCPCQQKQRPRIQFEFQVSAAVFRQKEGRGLFLNTVFESTQNILFTFFGIFSLILCYFWRQNCWKRQFWPSEPFWSTRVDHMITPREIQHWGIGGTYLVLSYPKQFGHTTNTRFGGSWKPFFCVWCCFLE